VNKGYFITGTDTNIGKTEFAVALMRAIQERGHIVNAMKPISAGCTPSKEGLLNDDVIRLQSQSSTEMETSIINPYAFEPAIAPHIAAQEVGIEVKISHIKSNFDRIVSNSDYVVVEGVGGWCVPINKFQTTVDILHQLHLPIIMVVGIKLGCINHAMITYQAIKAARLKCIAWVANIIDPNMQRAKQNYHAIHERLDCPCIATIPYMSTPKTEEIYRLIELDQII